MTPFDYYQEQLANGFISEDPQQLIVLEQLQKIHDELIAEWQKRLGILASLRKPHVVQGLYVWGGVGIGKTFLMDCFFQTLPFKEKMRMHFHPFMQMIHKELKKHQGEKNPLQTIAKKIARNAMVICFDEFFVNDIADAMILAKLLEALFAQGVCLVATSNTMPDDLYKKGLQRRSFLPAIALLKQYTTVMYVPTTIDYRLRHLKEAGIFHTPNDAKAEENMEKSFALLSIGKNISDEPIELFDRTIIIRKQADDIIWFDFETICTTPRSQHDYIALAEKYHTVFVSNIPVISANAKNTISLFIKLIDVFYDARVRLIFSAEKKVEELYTEGDLLADFGRTKSRLLEMQSETYFSARFS